jgi:hypothetical protein
MADSALKTMQGIVAHLEREERLCNMLDRLRQIDENPISTLERLIRERAGVVELLDKLKAPHRDFDHTYKDNLVEVLRSLLAPHLAVANATKR